MKQNDGKADFPMSDFARNVIEVVGSIPKGKTMTYRQVAGKAGSSGAARAVGNILNKYYFYCQSIGRKTIPCHRVVRSDNKPGGYAKGSKEKQRLLKKERG